jgi:hypothetical protein
VLIRYLSCFVGLAHSLTEPEVQAVFTNASLLSVSSYQVAGVDLARSNAGVITLQTLETVLLKGAKDVGESGKNDDKEGGGEDVRFVIYDGKVESPVSPAPRRLLVQLFS